VRSAHGYAADHQLSNDDEGEEGANDPAFVVYLWRVGLIGSE